MRSLPTSPRKHEFNNQLGSPSHDPLSFKAWLIRPEQVPTTSSVIDARGFMLERLGQINLDAW